MSHRNLLLSAGKNLNRCCEGSNESYCCACLWQYQTAGIMWLQKDEMWGTICDIRFQNTDSYSAGATANATDCSLILLAGAT
jgi:hypothetical protein